MIQHLSLRDFTSEQQVSIYSFTIGLEKEEIHTTFGHNCIKSTLHCFSSLWTEKKFKGKIFINNR